MKVACFVMKMADFLITSAAFFADLGQIPAKDPRNPAATNAFSMIYALVQILLSRDSHIFGVKHLDKLPPDHIMKRNCPDHFPSCLLFVFANQFQRMPVRIENGAEVVRNGVRPTE